MIDHEPFKRTIAQIIKLINKHLTQRLRRETDFKARIVELETVLQVFTSLY